MELVFPFDITCESGEYVVTFPDVPEAITGADTEEEAIALAGDALIAALDVYISDRLDIPKPSPRNPTQYSAVISPLHAAKISLYIAMREEGLSMVGLANQLSVDEKAVRRMLDLDYVTKIESIHKALQSVFANRYRLVTSLESVGRGALMSQ